MQRNAWKVRTNWIVSFIVCGENLIELLKLSNIKLLWSLTEEKNIHISFYENTLFEKSIFCPKIQFWQNPNIFTSFSPKFFLTIFLVKSKLSTAKKSKTATFSRIFHPKKNQQFFSGNQSWIFGQKRKITLVSWYIWL